MLSIHKSDFNNLRNEWNELLTKSESNNIFLTWEWVSTWWRFFGEGQELLILTVKNENDELVGIAPLKISQRYHLGISYRQVEFITSGEMSSDYLDFILVSGSEKPILWEILQWLTNHMKEGWDLINLTDISENSPSLKIISEFTEKNSLRWVSNIKSICPYVLLPMSWEEYYKLLPTKFRGNIKRREKKLKKRSKVEFLVWQDSYGITSAINDFQSLHQKRMSQKGLRSRFGSEKYKRVHEEIAKLFAQRQWLYLTFLMADNRKVASRYGYIYNNKVFDYQTGFDPEYNSFGVGHLLIYHILKDLSEKGVRELDFLSGNESYKYEWATRERRTKDIRIWNNNIKGIINSVEFPFVKVLKRLIKGPLTFFRPYRKNLWRKL